MSVSDYFKKPTPAWKTHPQVRYWQRIRNEPTVRDIHMELYRPKEGLVFRPADIYVHVTRADGQVDPPQKLDWEDVVNEGLLNLRVKAVDEDNEAQRFSLWLQSMFIPVEGHFGETFFSPVLREAIAEGPFGSGPNVSAMLKRIASAKTSRETAWEQCREMIDNVLAGRWDELTSADKLAYSEDAASRILETALALFLDERFHISDRDALGWT